MQEVFEVGSSEVVANDAVLQVAFEVGDSMDGIGLPCAAEAHASMWPGLYRLSQNEVDWIGMMAFRVS